MNNADITLARENNLNNQYTCMENSNTLYTYMYTLDILYSYTNKSLKRLK